MLYIFVSDKLAEAKTHPFWLSTKVAEADLELFEIQISGLDLI